MGAKERLASIEYTSEMWKIVYWLRCSMWQREKPSGQSAEELEKVLVKAGLKPPGRPELEEKAMATRTEHQITLSPGSRIVIVAGDVPTPEPAPEQERCYGCELLLLPEGYHKQRWSQIHLCFKPVCIRCFNSTDDNHSRIDSLKCGNEDGQAQGHQEGMERPVERP